MTALESALAAYGEYHRDRRNVATHLLGIPMIFLAVIVLLSRPVWPVEEAVLTPAIVLSVLAGLFYLRLDLRLSAGLLATDTKRSVALEATPYALTSDQNSVTFAAEGGIGFALKGEKVSIVPRASLRFESIGFGKLIESGGPMALAIERQSYQALESRLGMSLASTAGRVRAYLELNYAHDFLNQAKTFGASFAGGKTIAPFALGLTDNDWVEINGGLSFGLGGRSTFSIEADSTLFRNDLRSQSYRGRMNIEF